MLRSFTRFKRPAICSQCVQVAFVHHANLPSVQGGITTTVSHSAHTPSIFTDNDRHSGAWPHNLASPLDYSYPHPDPICIVNLHPHHHRYAGVPYSCRRGITQQTSRRGGSWRARTCRSCSRRSRAVRRHRRVLARRRRRSRGRRPSTSTSTGRSPAMTRSRCFVTYNSHGSLTDLISQKVIRRARTANVSLPC